jgi:hypothetical protein
METSTRSRSWAVGTKTSSSHDSKIYGPKCLRGHAQSSRIWGSYCHVIQITDRWVTEGDNLPLKGNHHAFPLSLSVRSRRRLLLAGRDRRLAGVKTELPRLCAPQFVSEPRRFVSVPSRKIQLPRQMIHPRLGAANNRMNQCGTFVHYWPAIKEISLVREYGRRTPGS